MVLLVKGQVLPLVRVIVPLNGLIFIDCIFQDSDWLQERFDGTVGPPVM